MVRVDVTAIFVYGDWQDALTAHSLNVDSSLYLPRSFEFLNGVGDENAAIVDFGICLLTETLPALASL